MLKLMVTYARYGKAGLCQWVHNSAERLLTMSSISLWPRLVMASSILQHLKLTTRLGLRWHKRLMMDGWGSRRDMAATFIDYGFYDFVCSLRTCPCQNQHVTCTCLFPLDDMGLIATVEQVEELLKLKV